MLRARVGRLAPEEQTFKGICGMMLRARVGREFKAHMMKQGLLKAFVN
jgi:hypothetical protein